MKWTGRCTRQGLTRGRKTVGAVLSTQKPATARNAVVNMNTISISRRFEANVYVPVFLRKLHGDSLVPLLSRDVVRPVM
jgi:hypothetical protein